MPLLLQRLTIFSSAAILLSSPLIAQSSSYHIDLEDEAMLRQPRVILVNDSEKPIEAFFASQRCSHSGGITIQDLLDSSGSGTQIYDSDGKIARNGVPGHGGSWKTLMIRSTEMNRDIVVEQCEPRINAVLFADGTWDGSEDYARFLKARRDGVAAQVDYWAERVEHANLGSSVIAELLADANRLCSQDQANINKYPVSPLSEQGPSPLAGYWWGRQQVDTNILSQLEKGFLKNTPEEKFSKISDWVSRWKKKIDSNVALKNLNAVFLSVAPAAEPHAPSSSEP